MTRKGSAEKKLTPVRLPPGRARLVTKPSLTASSATMNKLSRLQNR